MLKPILLNDLSRRSPEVRTLIDDAISRVVSSGWFVLGPENAALENELSEYLGVSHTVLLGNGTDALEISLRALGVTTGDRVVTVANAGGYASTAIALLGAEAVYCDVDENSLLMTAETLAATLDTQIVKPKVVIVTHLYGAMAPVSVIVELAKSRNILVIEDCAQSFGAKNASGFAGTFGDIATTSFYPTKNLGALGDGGAVFCHNPDLATMVRQLRQYGWTSKYSVTHPGGSNSRMDEIQAAIVRVMLTQLDQNNAKRMNTHARFESVEADGFRFVNHSGEHFVAHLAVVVAQNRDRLMAHLGSCGISSDIHYPIPDHKQQGFAWSADLDLPVTESMSDKVLSIPIYPELDEDEILRIMSALETYSADD